MNRRHENRGISYKPLGIRDKIGPLLRRVVFTKQAQKDAKKLSGARLRPKAEQPIEILSENPHRTTPPFEKLLGDLSEAFSRRINIQHRLVYQVLDSEKMIKVIRMWTHYE